MRSWLSALARTRRNVAKALTRLFADFAGRRVSEADLEDLEATMVAADVPVRLASELRQALENAAVETRADPKMLLRRILLEQLGEARPFDWRAAGDFLAVLIVGVNGSGKTTTCAKLARMARQHGRKPLLGATDTYRAAGSDQLKIWAGRLSCEVVAGRAGADAAAVAFDAMTAARARDCDVVIIDTAGRMHTKQPLMEELGKVRRAMAKRTAGAPHETWLVLDASLGQNALAQARVFHEAVPLTGVIVAKLDGSAKAGFVFGIARELKLPIRFVGLGEGPDDLAPFDPQAFVDALLGVDENGN